MSEAAIQALGENFKGESIELVLLVDSTNTFKSIKGKVFLHNISVSCPAISTFLNAAPFVVGGTEVRLMNRALKETILQKQLMI